MDRIINISTTSFATLEDFAPPFNLRHPDPKASFDLALSLLETAGRQGADLVWQIGTGYFGAREKNGQ